MWAQPTEAASESQWAGQRAPTRAAALRTPAQPPARLLTVHRGPEAARAAPAHRGRPGEPVAVARRREIPACAVPVIPHICLRVRLRGPESGVAVSCGNRYCAAMSDDRRLGERVNLTLPPEVCRVLDRMGKVTGAGRATIVREWLIEAAPQLDEMARAMELASKKNIDAFKVIGDTLNELSQQSGQLSLDVKRERRKAMRKRAR